MSTYKPKKDGMIPRSTPQGGTYLPQLAILTLLLSVGIVVGGVAMGNKPKDSSGTVDPDMQAAESVVQDQDAPSLGREEVAVLEKEEVRFIDPLAALEQHWGSQWPYVKDELFGQDLAAQANTPLLTWDESAEIHLSAYRLDERHLDSFYRRLMKWPGREFRTPVQVPDINYTELTASTLASQTNTQELAGLSQGIIDQIDRELSGINDDLDSRIREFMDLLDRAIELEFNSGGLVKAPLKMRNFKPNPDAVFGRTVRGNGWHSRLEVTGERYPYLADLDHEIKTLRSKRKASLDLLVASYL